MCWIMYIKSLQAENEFNFTFLLDHKTTVNVLSSSNSRLNNLSQSASNQQVIIN